MNEHFELFIANIDRLLLFAKLTSTIFHITGFFSQNFSYLVPINSLTFKVSPFKSIKVILIFHFTKFPKYFYNKQQQKIAQDWVKTHLHTFYINNNIIFANHKIPVRHQVLNTVDYDTNLSWPVLGRNAELF